LKIVSVYFLLHPLRLLGDQLIHPFRCGPVIGDGLDDNVEN
jgi:hypothetical protein